ncbi:extracellular catalytic domain type 1 short-chain-length polyhydroxyalkanoate depolymerase [Microbacterium jejuense]|uniref:extracellular catalytic domain type 1 short-chain-length polyhydroxyalkanoate depolymerase n=1 Tax=Microbacterium jejuense TaxID=1263637 RepID=UPI0031E8BDD9
MPRLARWRRTAVTVAIAAAAASVAVAAPAAAVPAAAGSPNVGSCTPTLAPGTSQLNVVSQGGTYSVRVHTPPTARGTKLPLVLDLHGSNNNSTIQSMVSGLDALADEKGFIVVEPNGAVDYGIVPGIGQAYAWNVPGVPTTANAYPAPGTRDDVQFLVDVIAQVGAAGCVDANRVYATGNSGGARMASALACAEPKLIAAIAPVSGLRAGRPDPAAPSTIDTATCDPQHPVPVVTFHGTADPINPYQGNALDPRWGYTVLDAAERWADIDHCTASATATPVSAHVTRTSWTSCRAGGAVEVYTVAGAGHTWPGSLVPMGDFGMGSMTTEISASAIMWDFFAAHPRRG